ncbi:MAG: Gfo/Idh/MocA family oxidoreductase, partial [Halioglobus sp.]|nr:Gfo/Idh/MocA family oxidoreductase [Halioglobus sp.]
MSQTAVRLGLVGLGNIARQHLANLRDGLVEHCHVTALCSRQKSELSAQLKVPHFSSVDALVASGECDAVLVATPTWHHFEAGACALAGGLHVMMEKPLGLSLGEGEALLDLQGEEQVFAVMLNQRADPLFRAMQACIADGALGGMTRTHWTMTNWFRPEVYFQVSDWRATWRGEGGGLLLNQCIHNLDIFQWLCGMPESVQAF